MPTALEIAQGRNAPLTAGLFWSVNTRAPLFAAFDFRTSSDTKFQSLGLVSLPNSEFVNFGEGFAASNAQFELRDFDCSLIGGQVLVEKITERKWNQAHPGMNWKAIQTDAKIKADILNVERQLIKGRLNNAKGFPGAKEMTPFVSGNVLAMTDTPDDYDFQRTVINVAGTTATTASSAYSFVFGPMECQGILGNDQTSEGELFHVGESFSQAIAPDPNAPTKLLEHEIFQMHGYVGLSVSGFNQQIEGENIPVQYSVRRACNITKDSGKGMTDKVMEKLAMSHGTGMMPSLFAMSARSADQLAESRQKTAIHVNLGGGGDARNFSGSINPARPREWEGIPIVTPQATVIGNTDAIEA